MASHTVGCLLRPTGFGQQFAAAVQPPVLCRAGSEIYPHGAFVARAVQYDAVFFSGQVEAGGEVGYWRQSMRDGGRSRAGCG